VHAVVLKRLVCAGILAFGAGALLTPAVGQPVVERTLWALLPLTPDQAREVAGLLRSPDVVLLDVAAGAGAVVDGLPSLPDALIHDLLTTPSRHLAILHAVITDMLALNRAANGEGGLFRHTLRAFHRSAILSAGTRVLDRLIHPENRTARLAIVLTARYHGLPMETSDLDLLRRAIDRDAPDLGPLVARVAERLVQTYGRDAVRLLLLP
jgi:hypothetical protein